MNVVLLSGGSGKRLWPLSNEVRSKQFIKIFKTPDGGYESMLQRVYRQITSVDSGARITIATSKSQVSAIHNQLGSSVGISVEPCRRDTFPAIVLAAAYLHDIVGVSPEEAVVICPVDPYVNNDFFEAVQQLWELAKSGTAGLCLMGIRPAYPSEKYGYIIPESEDRISRVSVFREKPDAETAKQYIAQGGLWNGGVFALRLGYLLSRAHELLNFTDYADLYARYADLPKISFDYAVVEHEKDICVINELDIPILATGLKNLVITASSDGILVSDKESSSYIKPYVDELDQQIMFAEKSWGNFRVLDVEEKSMTIKVTLSPGHHMNYHSHDRRDEVWTVISGRGKTIIDGMEQPIKAGDVITMQSGCKHTVVAETELHMIEVQLGENISSRDKHKYEFDFAP